KHALFGERLSIDLDNAMFDVAADLADKYDGDLDAFKLEVLQKLAITPDFTEAELKNADLLTNLLYSKAKENYNAKMQGLAETVLPQFKEIFEQQGDRIQNIVIPFTDGIKGMQVYVDLKEAIETNCANVRTS